MKKLIKEILTDIQFPERYRKLCNQFSDINKGISFRKFEISSVLDGSKADMEYSSKGKFFFKVYYFGQVNLRFILPYKYGFIDCMYIVWDTKSSNRIRGSFAAIALLSVPDFLDWIPNRFPIASSKSELEEIVTSLLYIHQDFLKAMVEKFETRDNDQ